uniref:cGMP-dependent protein kinase interacting domain-containing protein n=1 Tax=Anopheles coluzzii TaxID=1518534 RepID=A0A8W7PMJ2_ANOCL
MERIHSASGSDTATVRHVVRCERFDSREAKDNSSSSSTSSSFYQDRTSSRTGLAADGCYFNAVFNDSSETYADVEEQPYDGHALKPDSINTAAMVRVTVPSTPVAADGSHPFRRGHSMRSSFNSLRGLRTKLKQGGGSTGVGSTTVNGHNSARLAYCHLPAVGDLARSPSAASTIIGKRSSSRSSSSSSGTHFARSASDDVRRSLRNKLHKLKITYHELRRLQTKVLQDKSSTLDESSEVGECESLPENIPPKAAALLMEGFCRASGVQSSLKVHRRAPEEKTTSVARRSNSLRAAKESNKKLPTKKQHKQLQAQLDKLTQINIHLHALFSAVEHGHLEKARTILESTDVDVNSLNSDGLTPLDVAVLSNNRSMTKMLLQQGAIENAHSVHAANSNMGLHLNNLLCDAEATVHELGNFDGSQAGGLAGSERTGTGTNAGKTTFSNIIGK